MRKIQRRDSFVFVHLCSSYCFKIICYVSSILTNFKWGLCHWHRQAWLLCLILIFLSFEHVHYRQFHSLILPFTQTHTLENYTLIVPSAISLTLSHSHPHTLFQARPHMNENTQIAKSSIVDNSFKTFPFLFFSVICAKPQCPFSLLKSFSSPNEM